MIPIFEILYICHIIFVCMCVIQQPRSDLDIQIHGSRKRYFGMDLENIPEMELKQKIYNHHITFFEKESLII